MRRMKRLSALTAGLCCLIPAAGMLHAQDRSAIDGAVIYDYNASTQLGDRVFGTIVADMKPALALCYDYSTPFEDCARHARDAGFEVVSLGMKVDYSGFATSHGRKSIKRVLEDFGCRLAVLHVSDNHGEKDDHLLPREGIIDWERFTRFLASLTYGGDMLLECVIERSEFTELDVFAREAYSRATQLIESVGRSGMVRT